MAKEQKKKRSEKNPRTEKASGANNNHKQKDKI